MKMNRFLCNLMQRMLRCIFQSLVRMADEDRPLEVERKYRIGANEVAGIRERLQALGFKHFGDATMQDTFLPTADKGEMMRVRRESLSGETSMLLTHKTWVATLDGGRERQEAERPTRPLLASLLILLGRICQGSALLGFSKVRSLYRGENDQGELVVSVDNVSGLGEYSGLYLELEIIVAPGSDPGSAKSAIYDLARQLFGEAREETKQSYLDLLRASRAEGKAA